MRRKKKNIIVVQWILILFLFCGCAQSEADDFQEIEITEAELESQELADDMTGSEIDSENSEEIVIYVCGEVQSPGVYSLKANSRIYDAIMAAGGLTEEAAEDSLNQAQILTDGEMIYVPSKDEDVGLISNGIENQSNKISINRASQEELMTLQGIGESKAAAIIAYREAHGGFQSLDELMQVDGIKEGTYEKIKDLISL